jgi:hypothetical protein
MMSFRNFRLALTLALAATTLSCTEDKPAASTPKSDLNLKAILPDDVQMTQAAGGGTVVMSSPGAIVSSGPGTITSPLPPADITPAARSTATATPAPPVAAAPAAPPVARQDVVVPPKDAKWTIFCTVVGGAGHVERAKNLKDRLAAATHSNKWYLVHDDEKSTIYYGFYRDIQRGTPDGNIAQADRLTLANMKNQSGEAPLALCSFMMLDKPAPQAPAEWDLASYPRSPEHYWSLQIAAYTPDAKDEEGHDRKWAAVESVKALRAQGIPAYFYHGDAVSSVCVGLWPEAAVKKQDGGNDKGNASATNADTDVFVSAGPLPRGMRPGPIAPDGHRLRSLAPRIEILDQTMYETAKRFPSHMTNSVEVYHKMKNPETGMVQDVPEPSFLVLVPEARANGTGAVANRQVPIDAAQMQQIPPSLLGTDNRLPPQPGVGRLRQVGQ